MDLRQRLGNHPSLDQDWLDEIEEAVKERELLTFPQKLNPFPNDPNPGYRQHAVKCCAKHGWLEGLKFLRDRDVPLLWAPMFASMKGHIHILEWIDSTTTYLRSLTVAMECVSYGIAVGGNPKAALWLMDRGYIGPKFVVQSAVRKGEVPLLDEVYLRLRGDFAQPSLNEVLKDSFPYVWINAIGAPHKVSDMIEYLVSISNLELENEWRRQVFHRNKKRMRLAKVLGNWTAPTEVQKAFNRGMAKKFSGWSDISDQERHIFLETLMESQTDTRLAHVSDLVDQFIFGKLQAPELSCDLVSG